MPLFRDPDDIPGIFQWQESEGPPDTEKSLVARWLLAYLIGRFMRLVEAYPMKVFFQDDMVPAEYRPKEGPVEQAVQDACPGNHDVWAATLFCQEINHRDPGYNRLTPAKLAARALAMNQALRTNSARLYVLYLRTQGIQPSAARGARYQQILRSAPWRTSAAARQAAGTWRNPSWEMFGHWAKLVACGGSERCEEPNQLLPDRINPLRPDPLNPRDRDKFPPPFIDPETTSMRTTVEKNVLAIYSELTTRDPKVNLNAYADIAPNRWESFSPWLPRDLSYEMLEPVAKEMAGPRLQRQGDAWYPR